MNTRPNTRTLTPWAIVAGFLLAVLALHALAGAAPIVALIVATLAGAALTASYIRGGRR